MSPITSTITNIIHTAITNPGFLVVFKGLYYTAPVWVTLILASVLWHNWLLYARTKFINSQTYVLLEIKLPKEVFKSPQAMEFLFNAMHLGFGEDKLKIKLNQWPIKITNDYYWKGSVRPWFSLEICSIDGKLHFFIWGRSSFKTSIEAQLYSQFPGVEIFEVPDYTLPVSYDPAVSSMWAAEFELTKPDSYPIKTYIDYGLDKDPKEEYKVDPLTPLVEFMSSIGPGHQAWLQILITAHKAEDWDPATGKYIDNKWAKGAEKEISTILEKAKPPKPAEGSAPLTAPRALTDGEKETIYAIERSISKPGFDAGIRGIYIAPKDIFNRANSGGIVSGLRHFSSNNLNGFKGQPPIEKDFYKQQALDAYKNRGYFWNEYRNKKIFILNTEELATIFHFPGGISTTPSFERVGSKKAEAPSNLPI